MSEEDIQFEFDTAFQHKIATLIMRDNSFARSTVDLVKPEYFVEAPLGAVVRIIQEHVKVYKSVPDMKILPTLLKDELAKKRIRPDMIDGVKAIVREALTADVSNPAYVKNKVKDFAKHQATEQGMMKILESGLMEKKDWGAISKIFRETELVGADEEGGDYDYWREIANRTAKREDYLAGKIIRDGITTGYSDIDNYLYHLGWGRKELSCMMGPAKSGKSLSLGDFAKNASMAGYNVFYDTLEVGQDIIADRLDAALSDTLMRDLNKDPAKVRDAIERLGRTAGRLDFKEHGSGSLKPSMLDNILERKRAEGIIYDLVVVDYADIMAAEYRSDDLRENLRTIYLDYRALMFKWNAAGLTATQTNRDGAKAMTSQATDVGDDWNKARTLDLLLGLNATLEEIKMNQARITWLLNRNGEANFSLRIQQDRSKMQFLKKVLDVVR